MSFDCGCQERQVACHVSTPVTSLNTNVDGMTIGDAKLCPQEPDTGVGGYEYQQRNLFEHLTVAEP